MKKYTLPFVLLALVSLQACNEKAPAPAEEKSAANSSDVTLESTQQRLSYGIAYGLGQRMKTDNVPMDVDAFAAGLRDAMSGAQPRMTPEEISAEMKAYQEKAVAEQKAAQEALSKANEAASAAFLSENATRDGVTVTDSGLQYEVLTKGDGPVPGPDDTVEVNYRGTLIDGTEFDSSYSRGQTVTFGVSQVIPGWTEALQLMPVGSKWKLYIPADLAYGAGGAGQTIGPNAALIFEVELVSIKSADQASETPAEK